MNHYDTWQIYELLHNAESLVSTFQYETLDLLHDMVQSTVAPYEEVLVSLGLDRTIVTLYDQNISLAVESMHALSAIHSKEPMVAGADSKKQRFLSCYSKAHDKDKVKSNTPGVNLADDPEPPVTSFQFHILSSKMGQMLKAADKNNRAPDAGFAEPVLREGECNASDDIQYLMRCS